MSIPLDRYYNYLDDLSNGSIIIYRWHPHGSKNLNDVHPEKYYSLSWLEIVTKPVMLMHDQEPVNFHYYQQQPPVLLPNYVIDQYQEFRPLIESMPRLRTTVCKFNIHDKVIICHSEKNSRDIESNRDHFIDVYFWSHALIALDWFRYAEHDPLLVSQSAYNKKFLIYNRAWSGTREYRLKFADMLIDSGLLDSCQTRLSFFDNDVHYTQHKFSNSKFNFTRNNLEQYFEENNSLSTASADYNNVDYRNCAIEVVLETLFDESKNHLTEKTLRPIACKKPFILAATPHSLQYLRDYGFKTFGPWIDESYDQIQDPLERLQAIIREMQRIDLLTPTQQTDLWAKLNEIAEYNHQLFFSKQFHRQIVNEYQTNLDSAVIEAQKYRGQWMKKFLDVSLINPSVPNVLSSEFRGKSQQDVDTVLSMLSNIS